MNPRISFAQHHEDILLDRFFGEHYVGTYLDIGANHPISDSNTYLFYNKGWTGTIIEPQLHFQALYQQLRPRDRFVSAAVGEVTGAAAIYRVHDAHGIFGLSTLDPQIAAMHRAQGVTVSEEVCHTISLRDLVPGQKSPDFVSVDVEGFEEIVLRTFPYDAWQPAVIVVESVEPNSYEQSHQLWEPHLLSHDYEFVQFNGVNRFYLHKSKMNRRAILAHPVCKLDPYITLESMMLRNRIADLEQRLQQSQKVTPAFTIK